MAYFFLLEVGKELAQHNLYIQQQTIFKFREGRLLNRSFSFEGKRKVLKISFYHSYH